MYTFSSSSPATCHSRGYFSFSFIKDDLLEFDQSDHFTYTVECLFLHFRVLNLTMATEGLPLHSYLNFDLAMDHVYSFFHWLSRYCY